MDLSLLRLLDSCIFDPKKSFLGFCYDKMLNHNESLQINLMNFDFYQLLDRVHNFDIKPDKKRAKGCRAVFPFLKIYKKLTSQIIHSNKTLCIISNAKIKSKINLFN
jgi:hypothetical protein